MSGLWIGISASSGWITTILRSCSEPRRTLGRRWQMRCTRALPTVAGPKVTSPGLKSFGSCHVGNGWRQFFRSGRSRNQERCFIAGSPRGAIPCLACLRHAIRAACANCIDKVCQWRQSTMRPVPGAVATGSQHSGRTEIGSKTPRRCRSPLLTSLWGNSPVMMTCFSALSPTLFLV